jgi:hypothetical protein
MDRLIEMGFTLAEPEINIRTGSDLAWKVKTTDGKVIASDCSITLCARAKNLKYYELKDKKQILIIV